LYPSKDAPKFVLGNAWSFGVVMMAIFLFTVLAWVYRRRNKQKETMSELPAGQEWDDRAPDFKYQT
jgi:cbb3-type cytochrome oxidase subunit 3